MHTSPIKLNRRLSLMTVLMLALVSSCKESGSKEVSTQAASKEEAASPKVVKLAFVTNNASEFWKISTAGIRKYERESKQSQRRESRHAVRSSAAR